MIELRRRLTKYATGFSSAQVLRNLLLYTEGFPYWIAAAIVAFAALAYSTLFELGSSIARYVYALEPYALFVLSPACFVLASWLVRRFGPEAAGSGVPQVTRVLEQTDPSTMQVSEALNLRMAAVVIASSVLCALGAGSLGREGPMVHIAACIFFFTGRAFSRLWPLQEHRSWIIAGGAAGVAAAFNTPLAGVVFALEELAEQHFKQFKTVVITAAIVAGALAQWLSGKYLYFGYPDIKDLSALALPWAALIGVIAGLMALPFHRVVANRSIKRVSEAVERSFSIRRFRLSISFFCGLGVAAITVWLDKRSIGGGLDVVEEMLMSDVGHATIVLLIARFLGTVVTHMSGNAGGFLAPSLAIGAVTGSLLDTWLGFDNHNLSVMIGMAAALSATARAPFTAWVIVMEMTDRHSVIFPLMVASIVSYTIATWGQRKRVQEMPPAADQRGVDSP